MNTSICTCPNCACELKLIPYKEINNEIKNKDKDKEDIIKAPIKERQYIFDNYKCILIFCVVIGHFCHKYKKNPICYKIHNFVNVFHMPSFIFISGYFTKSENSRSLKGITKLILIYLIFNTIYLLFLKNFYKKKIDFFKPAFANWYLMSLIIWRITVNFFAKQYASIIISIIICLAVGFWEITNLLAIKRVITFYPFFILGYKFPKEYVNTILKYRKGFIKFILFFPIYIIFIKELYNFANTKAKYPGIFSFEKYEKRNTIRMRMKVIIYNYLMVFLSLLILPNIKIPLITSIGSNTLYIYLFHDYFVWTSKFKSYYVYNSFLYTTGIVIIFGSSIVSDTLNNMINIMHKNIMDNNHNGKMIVLVMSLSFILILIQPINFRKL